MIRVTAYTPARKTLWNDFVKKARNGLFMFERDYMDYHANRFTDHSLLFYDDDDLLALLPANRVGNELISHGGLTFGGFVTGRSMRVAGMLECFAALRSHMVAEGLNKLVYKAVPHIYHNVPAEEDLYALFANKAVLLKAEVTAVIDFRNPPPVSRGRRPHINRAEREGVSVAESEDFETYTNLLAAVLQERHGASPTHGAAEIKLLHSRFPDNIKLFAAFHQGGMVAGAILYLYPGLAHAQYLASGPAGREIGALDLVLTRLIERYGREKRYFDFGISTEDGGRVLNEGLMRQKEGFGGRAVAHQTWEICLESL